jgi:hypothetical protein
MEQPVVIREGEELNSYMREANAARRRNLLENNKSFGNMVNEAEQTANGGRRNRKSRKNRRDRKTRRQRINRKSRMPRKNRKNRKTRKN